MSKVKINLIDVEEEAEKRFNRARKEMEPEFLDWVNKKFVILINSTQDFHNFLEIKFAEEIQKRKDIRKHKYNLENHIQSLDDACFELYLDTIEPDDRKKYIEELYQFFGI